MSRKKAEKIVNSLGLFVRGLGTLGKCMMMSGKAFEGAKTPPSRPLLIMGNGPSLRDAVSRNPRSLTDSDLMAVNFAPNSQLFFDLKPRMLVLADPHFFYGSEKDENVAKLWDRLSSVNWPLTLYVPADHTGRVNRLIMRGDGQPNPKITVKPFNLTPAEGWRGLRHSLYSKGLAMPRPRNVMIPALMIGLREGYKHIRLIGADHSWSKTLWVDDQNRVVSIQPHFYPESPKEQERVAAEYAGYHLHDIYNSLAIAFRSYFDIAAYAQSLGVKIENCTPGSFIDAFPRSPLP